MDILRVLSRGIKQAPRKEGASTQSASKLPSAGTRTNPQLFHDEVGSKNLKRKRTTEVTKEETEEELSDLDFFAPKTEVKGERKHHQKKPTEEPPNKPGQRPKLLDEDECRQLLRSHRLKFTLLSSRQEKKTKVKKSKKKKALKVEPTEEKKQLFPQPLKSFSELRSTYDVSSRLADNLDAQSYKIPTEVQLASLPLLLRPEVALPSLDGDNTWGEGVDFMAVAPTGSGKTLSFLIPAINGVMRRKAQDKSRKEHQLEAIVIAPTRELANQIVNEGRKLTVGTGVRVVAMKKGMRVAAETPDGAQGSDDEVSDDDSDDDSGAEGGDDSSKPVTKADVLVTTPMLLLNFLKRGSSKKNLPTVQSLILDEADVLLDPLFRDQTLGIWSACTNSDLRLTFWSATIGSNIETLISDQLSSHAMSRGLSVKPLVRLVVGLKDTAVPNITHKLIYTATEPGKLLALRQLLHPVSGADSGPPLRPPFLVFTQTIERATALHEELKYDIPLEAGGPSRIAVLHSSLADSIRSDIMRRFRAGEIWVLVTTDVLARGVDFAGVNGIVNYDVPGSAAAYVHRAGRTGRAGREGGVAVTFYTKEDIPFVKSVANVIALSEKQAGKASNEADVQQWLLDALPNVKKEDKKRLKTHGVEARRSGAKAKITSKSAWERRKENNKRGAIQGSKRRKTQDQGAGDGAAETEWSGLDD
ncbi:putative atp dependent rna helicase protein [Phaeoacremonium minimum UCRPA7]|uniref:ATP-dependent RNA helicase ROK1 n=1 Tax=Phaeoacremonium minimum (strain UCR-PA7) TaxID=1286976 RepID=R8BH34_PHAM7|nr:putative atp dependent rna helicase protein [Phaeoacremonium minimum UCRPA7]EON98552.1 putative atp dependent rna helicase protein [Phaeoacremonium minimum UCRPA7]